MEDVDNADIQKTVCMPPTVSNAKNVLEYENADMPTNIDRDNRKNDDKSMSSVSHHESTQTNQYEITNPFLRETTFAYITDPFISHPVYGYCRRTLAEYDNCNVDTQ
tara:strand:+ start:509 stop:829 length:321 start_codon:yes stop_codon:yes gene_type:complete